MRKPRGYHLYKNINDIARVMKMLQDSSEALTLRYIGITQEDVDRDVVELELYGLRSLIFTISLTTGSYSSLIA